MGEVKVPIWMNFVIGGVSGVMAMWIVQPADLMRNQSSLTGYYGCRLSTRVLVQEMVKAEGFHGFYTAMSALVLQQMAYTAGRMGCFYTWLDIYETKDGNVPSFTKKLVMGGLSGAVGALMGSPYDAAMVLMTANAWLPRKDRKHFKNAMDAIRWIQKKEGWRALWKGSWINVVRATVSNSAQLATYAQVREMTYTKKREGIKLYFTASMISGFATTVASLPLDNIRQRVQFAKHPTTISSALRKLLKYEGVRALWTGFWPSYLIIGPYTVVTFLLLEEFYNLYGRFFEESQTR